MLVIYQCLLIPVGYVWYKYTGYYSYVCYPISTSLRVGLSGWTWGGPLPVPSLNVSHPGCINMIWTLEASPSGSRFFWSEDPPPPHKYHIVNPAEGGR